MYLVDTNVWLEQFLNQEKSEEVRQFLASLSTENLYITDFTFHSIGIILCNLTKVETLLQFVQDIFIENAVNFIHLKPEDIPHIVKRMTQFNLDFDDAYQYLAAEKHELTIISFDTDFDRTAKGRKQPAEILK